MFIFICIYSYRIHVHTLTQIHTYACTLTYIIAC